jgi:hypothetical protein
VTAAPSRPDHAREIRYALVDVRAVCERLGLLADRRGWTKQASGVIVRCPWHAEKTPSCSVRIARDGTIACRCHSCGATGDALSLVAAVHGLDAHRDFREVLRIAAELGGLYGIVAELEARGTITDRPRIEAPRRLAEPERDFPPADDVRAVWNAAGLVAGDVDAAAWASSRGLDPDLVDGRELARVIAPDAALPRWAVCRGGSWAETGYRLVVPMFDESGVMRSIRAGRVVDGEGPKRRPPFGHKASGVVMADTFALAMLAGTRAPTRVVITEGEPDFLTWATRTRDTDTAVLGIVGGSWSPGFASRCPTGAIVVIRTDHDCAGDAYAHDIAETLRGRCFLRRGGAAE